MKKERKKIVFMNDGKHFWNREKDIIKELNKYYEVFLFILYRKIIDYSIDDIIEYAKINNIHLHIIDYKKQRRARSIVRLYTDLKHVIAIKKN